MKKAFYLPGGGARGAYQAGVLKAISEITGSQKVPVDILSSVSAGSINAAFIAMHADDFPRAVSRLVELWSSLSSDKIFHTGNFALFKSVCRNAFSFIFHSKAKGGGYLFDTTPLKTLLASMLDFNKINENIEAGLLFAFEVSAACYDVPENASFFYSTTPQPCWKRIRSVAHFTKITHEHILASAAIPLFFPAINIAGKHYGDGALRLTAPLRPPIKLGADRILVIGTRRVLSLGEPELPVTVLNNVSFAKILGIMLHALFLDNLDRDIELLIKINYFLGEVTPKTANTAEWKPVKVLAIYPSIDLAPLTQGRQKVLPFLLRYLMRVFGSDEQSSDILSFLLFESEYCKDLVNIGYVDAMAKKAEIIEFFSS